MYIRTKKTATGKWAVQLVQNVRNSEGKPRQNVVKHVGTAANDEELQMYKNIAEYTKAEIVNKTSPYLFGVEEMAKEAIKSRATEKQKSKNVKVCLSKLREEKRCVVGIHDVYGKVFDGLNLEKVISNPARHQSAVATLKDIVLARIASPSSKRESVATLERDFGVSLDLNKVYRMMDKINDNSIEKLQDVAWSSAKTLLGEENINVIFYDATTIYFESFDSDDLKKVGLSKDFKFNQPQVLLCIFVTSSGIPIGYKLFPGNTYEGNTLQIAMDNVSKRFDVSRVVLVCDAGMLNEANMSLLESMGCEYIVGARLKNTTAKLQEKITDKSDFLKLETLDIEAKAIDLENGRKMIITHSQNRAKKDQIDRDKAIEKLLNQKSISVKSQLKTNRGVKKFIKIEGNSKVTIDQAKIDEDTKWDGLHGVVTNIKDMDIASIIGQYKGLWQVEETFRISKHDLKVRPIFHWKPERVKAHIAIAFMSLLCVRNLEYRVKSTYKKLSPEVIRNELNHVQVSILKNVEDSTRYAIPSYPTANAKRIYKVVNMELDNAPYMMN